MKKELKNVLVTFGLVSVVTVGGGLMYHSQAEATLLAEIQYEEVLLAVDETMQEVLEEREQIIFQEAEEVRLAKVKVKQEAEEMATAEATEKQAQALVAAKSAAEKEKVRQSATTEAARIAEQQRLASEAEATKLKANLLAAKQAAEKLAATQAAEKKLLRSQLQQKRKVEVRVQAKTTKYLVSGDPEGSSPVVSASTKNKTKQRLCFVFVVSREGIRGSNFDILSI